MKNLPEWTYEDDHQYERLTESYQEVIMQMHNSSYKTRLDVMYVKNKRFIMIDCKVLGE